MKTIPSFIFAAWLSAWPCAANPLVQLAGPVPVASYPPYATTFAGDGQCWMERDAGLTSAADSIHFTISVWLNFSAGNGVSQQILRRNNTRVQVEKRTSNLFRILLLDAASGATVAQIDQNSTNVAAITSSTGWIHLLCSVRNASSGGFAQLYINDTECATLTTFLANDSAIDFTDTDWAVGALVGGTLYFQGAMSEFYYSDSESIDLSVEANRRKFRSAGGDPVDLGSDGSTPTGNAPRIYLKSIYSSFTTNSGTGGNFTKYGTSAFTTATPP